jgi:hypothetical protein
MARGSQGLRRPRFSFFRFTYQTAQGRNPTPGHARSFSEQPPPTRADDISLLSVRSFRTRRAAGRRRVVCRYICWLPVQCQPGIFKFFHQFVTGRARGHFLSISQSVRLRRVDRRRGRSRPLGGPGPVIFFEPYPLPEAADTSRGGARFLGEPCFQRRALG